MIYVMRYVLKNNRIGIKMVVTEDVESLNNTIDMVNIMFDYLAVLIIVILIYLVWALFD